MAAALVTPGEELSELESLYQASLLAPSMHRGSRGVSPQPSGSKPGRSLCWTSVELQRLVPQRLKLDIY